MLCLTVGLAIIAAAVILALFVHSAEADRCVHGTRSDDGCTACDEPPWCPMCEGPCYDEPAGYSDQWRLP